MKNAVKNRFQKKEGKWHYSFSSDDLVGTADEREIFSEDDIKLWKFKITWKIPLELQNNLLLIKFQGIGWTIYPGDILVRWWGKSKIDNDKKKWNFRKNKSEDVKVLDFEIFIQT